MAIRGHVISRELFLSLASLATVSTAMIKGNLQRVPLGFSEVVNGRSSDTSTAALMIGAYLFWMGATIRASLYADFFCVFLIICAIIGFFTYDNSLVPSFSVFTALRCTFLAIPASLGTPLLDSFPIIALLHNTCLFRMCVSMNTSFYCKLRSIVLMVDAFSVADFIGIFPIISAIAFAGVLTVLLPMSSAMYTALCTEFFSIGLPVYGIIALCALPTCRTQPCNIPLVDAKKMASGQEAFFALRTPFVRDFWRVGRRMVVSHGIHYLKMNEVVSAAMVLVTPGSMSVTPCILAHPRFKQQHNPLYLDTQMWHVVRHGRRLLCLRS